METTAKCNLIIDSCCDLPYEMVNRPGIQLLEFPYIDEEGDHSDDFYRSITPHEFYEKMRNGSQPSTAQVPIVKFQELFTEAIESGVPTVYLSFTSGLSGSYNTALLVRDQLLEEHPDAELYVVDTCLASIAEALLVYEAINQRDNGMSARELADWAAEARYFIDAEFMVEDLEALRRGGRIPNSVAYAGSKLDVKPLLGITIEGKLSLVGVARGRKKGIKQLVEYATKRMSDKMPGRHVVIGNADCPKDAARLKELMQKQDEHLLFLESSIGPVIGSHVGPGMLAVVFWGNDKREDLSVADRIARKIKKED